MRDDDLLISLQMAEDSMAAHGRHHPGRGTDLHIGLDSLGSDAEMVGHHEAAHLELNYVTAYGLLLRAAGSQLDEEDADSRAITTQLVGLIGLCRVTHEIFATTTGVWRPHGPFGSALDNYPSYQGFLRSGRALAGHLLEWSFAAHTAMMAACWAAMQPPIGELLEQHDLRELSAERIPQAVHPDHRIGVLLRSGLDPAVIDVALPESWREQELRVAPLAVPRLHETFVAVASAYYQAFAGVLVDHGLPVYAFDGHKSDPTLHEWLEAHPAPRGEVIHFRPGAEGNDRFWPVTLSDGERIIPNAERELIAVHFADLPATVSSRMIGRDTFVRGEPDVSSVLVVVRPVRTLLRQYRVSRETAILLRAAATDGVITAARADVEFVSGRHATYLAVLSSRAQLETLNSLPSAHGVLASVSETCSWFPNWSHYWAPALMTDTHTVRWADFQRRLWLDGLETEHAPARGQPFTIGARDDPSGLAELLVWFSDAYDPNDPPFLVLGSRRTVSSLSSVLATLFGEQTLRTDAPPEWVKTSAIIQRLIEGEPWFGRPCSGRSA